MKYETTVIEVKTTVKMFGRSAKHTAGVMNEYQTVEVDGKTVWVPIGKVIHNNSVIAYNEYASRRYDIDLDRVYGNKEVTVQLQIRTPILPSWMPFKNLLEKLFMDYDLIPYWTGNCYAQLVTHRVYTKERFLRGVAFSDAIEFGDSAKLHKYHAGCDKSYPGICIAKASLCTDYTTPPLDRVIMEQRGENWCDVAMQRLDERRGYSTLDEIDESRSERIARRNRVFG